MDDLIGQKEIRWIERKFNDRIDLILPVSYERRITGNGRFSCKVPVQRFKLCGENRYRKYTRKGLVQ